MGQKSNPISLRLEKTNQHWSNCWYGDHSYTTQFLQDCRINGYFQNCSQQLKKIPAVLSLKHQRGQIEIALFSPRPARSLFPYGMAARGGYRNRTVTRTPIWYAREKEKRKRVDTLNRLFSATVPTLVETTLFNPNNYPALPPLRSEKQDQIVPGKEGVWKGLRTLCFLSQLEIMYKDQLLSDKSRYPPILHYPIKTKGESPTGNQRRSVVHPRRVKGALTNRFESSIAAAASRAGDKEGVVSATYRCKIHLFKIPSSYQSAFFIASRVVFLLQERVPFRQLKLRLIPELVQEIEKRAYIKGIRITCSGRVASRSKKAQKARTDSIQWGETGLNIFSESVHFASKNAQTTYGKLGVKVWVCYSAQALLM